MFTPLGVASPRTTGLQIPFVSPSAQPLSIDEGIEVVTTPASVNREENCSAQEPKQRAELHSPDRRVNLGETAATTPTTNMGDFPYWLRSSSFPHRDQVCYRCGIFPHRGLPQVCAV